MSSDVSNPSINPKRMMETPLDILPSPNYADTPAEGVNTQQAHNQKVVDSEIATQLYQDYLSDFHTLTPDQQRSILKKLPEALAKYLTGEGGPPPSTSSTIPMDEIAKKFSTFKLGERLSSNPNEFESEEGDGDLSALASQAKFVLSALYEGTDINIDGKTANGDISILSPDYQPGISNTNPLMQASQSGAPRAQNEWFTPGFMVALIVQMNELALSLQAGEIASLKTMLSQMNALWELAKNEAALNIQQGQLKANSLIAQGISNILNGALALGMVFKDFKAKKEAEQEYKEAMDGKANKYFDKAGDNRLYNKEKYDQTGELKLESESGQSKPANIALARDNLQKTESGRAELKELQKQESDLEKFRAEKGEFVNRAIMNKVRSYEGIQKAIESFNNAGVNFMQAYTELQTSAIDASLALNRGQQEILRKGAESSDRNMQTMLDGLREIWQMLNKVTDDNYRAFSANG